MDAAIKYLHLGRGISLPVRANHIKFVFRKILSALMALIIFLTSSPVPLHAEVETQALASLNLPQPGVRMGESSIYVPLLLKGMTLYPKDPFQFDFIVDPANSGLKGAGLKAESTRMIKYFLAALTVPEKDVWVNLSPYEKNRIIPKEFGLTEMGRDLLAQDYILKQLTASLIYPEKDLGKEFWSRVYAKAQQQFGTTNLPVNTFNKVWIIPDEAVVYEKGNSVFVEKARLKVLLDEDYLSLEKHRVALPSATRNDISSIGANIVRDLIIPELNREVNEGKNFAPIRQIYHALILATWFKEHQKRSLLSSIYVDQNKVLGVNVKDVTIKDQIYAQYLRAFRKGVFNYIKEDYDPHLQTNIPRKYFSGGFTIRNLDPLLKRGDGSGLSFISPPSIVPIRIRPINADKSMLTTTRPESVPLYPQELADFNRIVLKYRPNLIGSWRKMPSPTVFNWATTFIAMPPKPDDIYRNLGHIKSPKTRRAFYNLIRTIDRVGHGSEYILQNDLFTRRLFIFNGTGSTSDYVAPNMYMDRIYHFLQELIEDVEGGHRNNPEYFAKLFKSIGEAFARESHSVEMHLEADLPEESRQRIDQIFVLGEALRGQGYFRQEDRLEKVVWVWKKFLISPASKSGITMPGVIRLVESLLPISRIQELHQKYKALREAMGIHTSIEMTNLILIFNGLISIGRLRTDEEIADFKNLIKALKGKHDWDEVFELLVIKMKTDPSAAYLDDERNVRFYLSVFNINVVRHMIEEASKETESPTLNKGSFQRMATHFYFEYLSSANEFPPFLNEDFICALIDWTRLPKNGVANYDVWLKNFVTGILPEIESVTSAAQFIPAEVLTPSLMGHLADFIRPIPNATSTPDRNLPPVFIDLRALLDIYDNSTMDPQLFARVVQAAAANLKNSPKSLAVTRDLILNKAIERQGLKKLARFLEALLPESSRPYNEDDFFTTIGLMAAHNNAGVLADEFMDLDLLTRMAQTMKSFFSSQLNDWLITGLTFYASDRSPDSRMVPDLLELIDQNERAHAQRRESNQKAADLKISSAFNSQRIILRGAAYEKYYWTVGSFIHYVAKSDDWNAVRDVVQFGGVMPVVRAMIQAGIPASKEGTEALADLIVFNVARYAKKSPQKSKEMTEYFVRMIEDRVVTLDNFETFAKKLGILFQAFNRVPDLAMSSAIFPMDFFISFNSKFNHAINPDNIDQWTKFLQLVQSRPKIFKAWREGIDLQVSRKTDVSFLLDPDILVALVEGINRRQLPADDTTNLKDLLDFNEVTLLERKNAFLRRKDLWIAAAQQTVFSNLFGLIRSINDGELKVTPDLIDALVEHSGEDFADILAALKDHPLSLHPEHLASYIRTFKEHTSQALKDTQVFDHHLMVSSEEMQVLAAAIQSRGQFTPEGSNEEGNKALGKIFALMDTLVAQGALSGTLLNLKLIDNLMTRHTAIFDLKELIIYGILAHAKGVEITPTTVEEWLRDFPPGQGSIGPHFIKLQDELSDIFRMLQLIRDTLNDSETYSFLPAIAKLAKRNIQWNGQEAIAVMSINRIMLGLKDFPVRPVEEAFMTLVESGQLDSVDQIRNFNRYFDSMRQIIFLGDMTPVASTVPKDSLIQLQSKIPDLIELGIINADNIEKWKKLFERLNLRQNKHIKGMTDQLTELLSRLRGPKTKQNVQSFFDIDLLLAIVQGISEIPPTDAAFDPNLCILTERLEAYFKISKEHVWGHENAGDLLWPPKKIISTIGRLTDNLGEFTYFTSAVSYLRRFNIDESKFPRTTMAWINRLADTNNLNSLSLLDIRKECLDLVVNKGADPILLNNELWETVLEDVPEDGWAYALSFIKAAVQTGYLTPATLEKFKTLIKNLGNLITFEAKTSKVFLHLGVLLLGTHRHIIAADFFDIDRMNQFVLDGHPLEYITTYVENAFATAALGWEADKIHSALASGISHFQTQVGILDHEGRISEILQKDQSNIETRILWLEFVIELIRNKFNQSQSINLLLDYQWSIHSQSEDSKKMEAREAFLYLIQKFKDHADDLIRLFRLRENDTFSAEKKIGIMEIISSLARSKILSIENIAPWNVFLAKASDVTIKTIRENLLPAGLNEEQSAQYRNYFFDVEILSELDKNGGLVTSVMEKNISAYKEFIRSVLINNYNPAILNRELLLSIANTSTIEKYSQFERLAKIAVSINDPDFPYKWESEEFWNLAAKKLDGRMNELYELIQLARGDVVSQSAWRTRMGSLGVEFDSGLADPEILIRLMRDNEKNVVFNVLYYLSQIPMNIQDLPLLSQFLRNLNEAVARGKITQDQKIGIMDFLFEDQVWKEISEGGLDLSVYEYRLFSLLAQHFKGDQLLKAIEATVNCVRNSDSPEIMGQLLDDLRIVERNPSQIDNFLSHLSLVGNASNFSSLLTSFLNLSFEQGLQIYQNPQSIYYYLIPSGTESDGNQSLAEIQAAMSTVKPYLEPWHGATNNKALFLRLRQEVEATAGLSYEEFLDILQNRPCLVRQRYAGVIQRFLLKLSTGQAAELSPAEQDKIIDISIDVHDALYKMALGWAGGHAEDVDITFRELIRFNIDLSRSYLKQKGFKNVIEYFVLTSYNVYSRILDTPDKEWLFVQLMKKLIESSGLLSLAKMDSKELADELASMNLESLIEGIIHYGDYQHLLRRPGAHEVDLDLQIDARMARHRQVNSASLLMVDDNNSYFVENAIKRRAEQNGVTVVRSAMGYLSRRQELFGMFVPTSPVTPLEAQTALTKMGIDDIKNALRDILNLKNEEVDQVYAEWQASGRDNDQQLQYAISLHYMKKDNWRENMQWADGILMRMARAAQKALDNKTGEEFDLVLDNISSAPSSLRLLLNPVLWERRVEIPGHGPVVIPENMNFVLTMHRDTHIEDESFMNRPLISYIPEVTEADLLEELRFHIGLEEPVAQRLIKIFKDAPKDEEGVNLWSTNDLIAVAQRIAGISRDNNRTQEELVDAEAYRYLSLTLNSESKVNELREQRFKHFIQPPTEVDVNRGDGTLVFQGVSLPASVEFINHARANPNDNFEQLMAGFANNYSVGDLERSLMGQFVRAIKYGGRSIQLEGPSGEGKTEIGRVFARLINFELVEHTINADTDLGPLRGRFMVTPEGGFMIVDADYIKQIQTPKHVFLFNEPNTNEGNGVIDFLYPEISAQNNRSLGEFASTKEDEIVKTERIDANNLWLFTVNPQGMTGFGTRQRTPRRQAAHLTRFYVARQPAQTTAMIHSQFQTSILAQYEKRFSPILNSIHLALQQHARAGEFQSGQNITPREFLDAVHKFELYLQDNVPPDQAFARAIEDVYVLNWNSLADQERVRQILLRSTQGLSRFDTKRTNEERLKSAFLHQTRPVMVFGNATTDFNDVDRAIRDIDPKATIETIPLNYFDRKRQIIGGMVPANLTPEESKWKPFIEFREGLGIIAQVIEEARLNPEHRHYVKFLDYLSLNPQIASIFNEFFQTGVMKELTELISPAIAEDLKRRLSDNHPQLWQGLRTEYQQRFGVALPDSISDLQGEALTRFAQWFYSEQPKNLKIAALDYSDTLNGDARASATQLTPAEIDRFSPINIAEPMSDKWISAYIVQKLNPQLQPFASLITELTIEAHRVYELQYTRMNYEHNRMGRGDIDMFINELLSHNNLSIEAIQRIAFYCLGIGLREEYQQLLSFNRVINNPVGLLRYETRGEDVYFVADGIEYKTSLKPSEIKPESSFQAPTRILVKQIAGMLVGIKAGRTINDEGYPGGGKTSSVELELARRLNLPFNSQLMYEDIDLGEFLGKLSKEGDHYLVTSTKKDGNGDYLLDFLRAYTKGELYLLDEGPMGLHSQKAIELLTRLAQMDSFDLGWFHPGLAGHIVKKCKDPQHPFQLFIAENPAYSTEGRLPTTYGVDINTHKIWTENVLELDDSKRIIQHVLKNKLGDRMNKIPETLIDELTLIHMAMTNHGMVFQEDFLNAFKKLAPVPQTLWDEIVGLGWITKEGVILPAFRRLEKLQEFNALKLEGAVLNRVFRYISQQQAHPKKDDLSPRQMIRVAEILSDAVNDNRDLPTAFYEGLMASYFNLGESDFKRVWRMVTVLTNNRLEAALANFSNPIAVDVHNDYIQFNGIRLPKSSTPTNVQDDELRVNEPLGVFNRVERLMALGTRLHAPMAFIEEDGADALEIARNFSKKAGYEFYVFRSHPQVSRMNMLNAVLPVFTDNFNDEGVKEQESEDFKMALGFILGHVVTEEAYQRMTELEKKQQGQKILFFNLMDSIPERQRVLLNEILTTRKMRITNENGKSIEYRLPEWVQFWCSIPEDHQFSSAFINRYLTVRVSAITNYQEIEGMVNRRYPLVLNQELTWAYEIARQVGLNDLKQNLDLKYGHGSQDVFKLAKIIQMEKQRDIEAKRFKTNPIYYVMKALYIEYMESLAPKDRQWFVEEIVKKKFLRGVLKADMDDEGINKIYTELIEAIEEELSTLTRLEPGHEHILSAPLSQLQKGPVQLTNGIRVALTSQGLVIQPEGAESTTITNQQLEKGEVQLTSGLKVRRTAKDIEVLMPLVTSIGGAQIRRDEWNLDRSLSENTVPTREFVRLTDPIKILTACMLRAWEPVQDGMGFVQGPRTVLLNGESGTAKTTLINYLRRITGVPKDTINAHEELKDSDIMIGLGLEKGKFQLGIREFLRQVGTVNGKRFGPGSTRKILLFDEANASPDLMYFIEPLVRGEKRFTRYYAGQRFDIEVDPEVMLVLTFNPAEKYGGRFDFIRSIALNAEKFWTPNPLEYSRSEKRSILREYHRRGIGPLHEEQKAALGNEPMPTEVDNEFHEVDSKPTPVELDRGKLLDVEQITSSTTAQEDPTQEGAFAPSVQQPAQKMDLPDIPIEYDLNAIRRNAQMFIAENGQSGYLDFADNILEGYLKALADDATVDHDLQSLVLEAAGKLNPKVPILLKAVFKLYDQKNIEKEVLKAAHLALRRYFVQNGVYLFTQLINNQGNPYLQLYPERITNRLSLSDERLQLLGEDPALYQEERPEALMVKGDKFPGKNAQGYFEGEFAVIFELLSIMQLKGVPEAESILWTAYHELGHVLDFQRLKVRGVDIPKGIQWTDLVRMVNKMGIGIWMSENIELNSQLFPMIFSPNSQQYAIYDLVHSVLLPKEHKKDDYYVQASKGILNGLIRYWKEQGQMNDATEISNEFEPEVTIRVANKIRETSSNELNKIALIMYKNPQKYLSSAEAGKYRGQAAVSDGVSTQEFNMGVDGRPDVEIEQVHGVNVKVKSPKNNGGRRLIETPSGQGKGTQIGPAGEGAESQPGEGRQPPATPDQTPSDGGEKGSGKVIGGDEEIRGVLDDIVELFDISPQMAARFLEIFAGAPKFIRQYADAGDSIEMERVLVRDMEAFLRLKIIKSLASFRGGLTIDVSGSTMNTGLDKIFYKMTRIYSSLFYFAAMKNKNFDFTIAAVGDNYHADVLTLEQSNQKEAVQSALARLKAIEDIGGINTSSVFAGLRVKYQGKPRRDHQVEYIFTDGGEYINGDHHPSAAEWATLRQEALQLEKEFGINIVFIGVGAKDVRHYHRFIDLPADPTSGELIDLILRLSMKIVATKQLPLGDLSETLGLISSDRQVQVTFNSAPKQLARSVAGIMMKEARPGSQTPEPSTQSDDAAQLADKAQFATPGGVDLGSVAEKLQVKQNSLSKMDEPSFDPAIYKNIPIEGMEIIMFNVIQINDTGKFLESLKVNNSKGNNV